MAISGETVRSLPSLNIGVAASISSLVKFLVERLVHELLWIMSSWLEKGLCD